jgi:hypothetical protein
MLLGVIEVVSLPLNADTYRQHHDNVALLGPHCITGLEIHFVGLVQSQILIA